MGVEVIFIMQILVCVRIDVGARVITVDRVGVISRVWIWV